MSLKSKEKVFDMTIMRNFVAWGVAMAVAVVSLLAVAQDDLDSLLNDLESGSNEKPAAKAGAAAKDE